MVFISLAHHFDIPLLNPNIQPTTLVVYILITVMHIVSRLLLRDYNQLLFSLCFLINLMVEDYHAVKSQGKLVMKLVPMDVCTVMWRLALKPSYKTFISYPECLTCYPDNGLDACPKLCISKPLSTQQICGQCL
jgi:hypothetical protein